MTLFQTARRMLLSGTQTRAGLVRHNGKQLVDDVGAWYPYGTSLFWGLWAAKEDPSKLDRNLATAQQIGCDYTRDFGEVGGASWEDRAINPNDADYRDRLAAYLDRKVERFSLRTALTVFAGGSGADPNMTVDKIISAVRGREASILYFELANEAFKNFTDRDLLRRLVSKLRSAFPSMLVASSSPAAEWTAASMDLDVANFYIVHPERTPGDEDWRQVRQPVDSPDVVVPGDDNEPIGIQSSVAMLSDPLRTAMIRSVGLTSGIACFVQHTGAGVRGGGRADSAPGPFWSPRKANLDEQPELEPVAAAIRNIGAIMPVDAVNWRKVKGHWADSPLYADAIWSDDPQNIDHGCVRVYGCYTGNAYVENVIGVRRYVRLTQHGGGAHVRAINPLTLEVAFEKDVADGETFRLEGDQTGGSNSAYVVIGTR